MQPLLKRNATKERELARTANGGTTSAISVGYGSSIDFQDDFQCALGFGFSFTSEATLTLRGLCSYVFFGAASAQFATKMLFWSLVAQTTALGSIGAAVPPLIVEYILANPISTSRTFFCVCVQACSKQ